MAEQSPLSTGHQPTQLVEPALQCGGAHGASAWGVLDRLLDMA